MPYLDPNFPQEDAGEGSVVSEPLCSDVDSGGGDVAAGDDDRLSVGASVLYGSCW